MFISQIRRFDMSNWKTSISGILSLISVIGLAIISVQVPTALATPTLTHYWLMLTFGVTIISAIAKAVIGLNMNDAHSIPVIARTIVANGGLVATSESTTSNLVTK
jgi:hypothetical protein